MLKDKFTQKWKKKKSSHYLFVQYRVSDTLRRQMHTNDYKHGLLTGMCWTRFLSIHANKIKTSKRPKRSAHAQLYYAGYVLMPQGLILKHVLRHSTCKNTTFSFRAQAQVLLKIPHGSPGPCTLWSDVKRQSLIHASSPHRLIDPNL